VLAQEQRRLDASQSDLAGVDSELEALKQRMAQLTNERNALQRRMDSQERRVSALKKSYDKECTKNETCEQYETLVTTLDKQSSEVEKEMAIVRTDMTTSRTEINNLQREIDPLRTEYASLKCNDMVPGETSQETIDRCAAIFSQWNRLQARVNQLNSRLSELRSRYQQLLSQLRSIESRGKNYETYLASNCSSSAKLVTVRGYGGVRQRAEKLGKELDDLIHDATKLRGIEITVTPK